MENFSNIYDYIKQEEVAFKQPIPIYEDWEWSFAEHLKTSIYYLFGRLLTGNSDDKPVKNIVRRILKFRYAAENIDVKDIHIYVDDTDRYQVLSFLVKKYHDDVFVREAGLDKRLDSIKKEKINFGGALVQKEDGAFPKKVPLSTLAFCDQSNLMGAPFAIKMSMSPSELMEMKDKGWGDTKNGATMSIEDLIVLMEYKKEKDKTNERPVKTPGKYCDIYLVWGTMPDHFIGKEGDGFSLQLHIVTFLKSDKGDMDNGVSLFAKEDKDKGRFKFIKQGDGDGLENRAVGFGGVEELFEAQVWTNYSMIRKKEMLDAASKIIMQTTDPAILARHPSGLKDLNNLEIIEKVPGTEFGQVDTFPRNYQLFANSVNEWEEYAQGVSFATDPMLGEQAPAGTPFRSQERQVIQGKAPHEENVKEFASFIEELYQDWIIPEIVNKLKNGTKFLSELSNDELEWVLERISTNEAIKQQKEMVLNGEIPTDLETLKQEIMDKWKIKGKILPLEILKGELANATIKVKVSVAGNKDLVGITDKLTNIFRQVFANPQILENPVAAKIFSKILEYSGLDPVDFQAQFSKPQQIQAIPQGQVPNQIQGQPQVALNNAPNMV